MSSQKAGDLLAVVLDLDAVAWQSSSPESASDISLQNALEAVLVFCNAHLALTHENHLCVFGASMTQSRLLYSSLTTASFTSSQQDSSMETLHDSQNEATESDPNSFQQFRTVDSQITANVRKLLLADSDATAATSGPERQPNSMQIVGAMTKALSHINRFKQVDATKPALSPRVLAITVSSDASSQHVPIMNCIFAAQKSEIAIDVCKVLGEDTVFLQQASYLTSGSYSRPPHPSALLQYLLVTYLPGQEARKVLQLPADRQVDLRAACFCHRKIVDVGYVCSVCLSIHCSPQAFCVTCRSKFPIATLKSFGPRSHVIGSTNVTPKTANSSGTNGTKS